MQYASNPSIIPIDDDEYDRHVSSGNAHNDDVDFLGDLLAGVNPKGAKKDKNKNKLTDKANDKKPRKLIEPTYEGFVLTQVASASGERPTWGKVIQRPMPFDSAKLFNQAQARQRKQGISTPELFGKLSPDKQGVINQLIESRKLGEKDDFADWVLFDVEKVHKDVPRNFLRSERIVVALHVILKRQDRATGAPKAQSTKQNTSLPYDPSQIIDLSQPVKAFKDDKKDEKKKPVKDKKNKQDPHQDILDNIINAQPAQQHNRRQHPNQAPYPDERFFEDDFDRPDPFAGVQMPPAGGAIPVHQPPILPQHGPNPFAGVQTPPPGAIPVQAHQQFHNVPPQAPMAPHINPFQPEVPGTVPEQYAMPPHHEPAAFEPAYGPARINRRERSESRHRYAREMEAEAEERRLRSRSRRRREEAEERRRSESRRRHEADRRQDEQIMDLRRTNHRLTMDVDSLRDKFDKINLASGSSAASTERDSGMWSPTMSDRYSTPNTSPDRNRRPTGSLHRRKSSAARDMPRQRYYRDNRSRYPNERSEIQPAYTYQPRGDSRGRRPVEMLRRSQTYDDYPLPGHQQPRRPAVRYIEQQPRIMRPLSDYAHALGDADFDRGRGGGVDYLRHEPRRGSRQYEEIYDERRGGGRRYYG